MNKETIKTIRDQLQNDFYMSDFYDNERKLKNQIYSLKIAIDKILNLLLYPDTFEASGD